MGWFLSFRVSGGVERTCRGGGRTAPGGAGDLAGLLACSARCLIVGDLDRAGVAVAHFGLFMAHHLSRPGYAQALEGISAGMGDPARTSSVVHAATARQHPLLFGAHADLYPVGAEQVTENPPAVVFRDSRCVRCLCRLANREGRRSGLCVPGRTATYCSFAYGASPMAALSAQRTGGVPRSTPTTGAC